MGAAMRHSFDARRHTDHEQSTAFVSWLFCRADRAIVRIVARAYWMGILGPRGTLRFLGMASFLNRSAIGLLRRKRQPDRTGAGR